MRINDDVWLFVSGTLDDMQHESDRLKEAVEGLMIAPESPLIDVQDKTNHSLINALSLLINDEFESVDWFVLECDYGREAKQAGKDSDMRVIDTHDKLRWLIEL